MPTAGAEHRAFSSGRQRGQRKAPDDAQTQQVRLRRDGLLELRQGLRPQGPVYVTFVSRDFSFSVSSKYNWSVRDLLESIVLPFSLRAVA